MTLYTIQQRAQILRKWAFSEKNVYRIVPDFTVNIIV